MISEKRSSKIDSSWSKCSLGEHLLPFFVYSQYVHFLFKSLCIHNAWSKLIINFQNGNKNAEDVYITQILGITPRSQIKINQKPISKVGQEIQEENPKYGIWQYGRKRNGQEFERLLESTILWGQPKPNSLSLAWSIINSYIHISLHIHTHTFVFNI